MPKTRRLFFASSDLGLGIFSSEMIESICLPRNDTLVIPNLTESLIKKKKLGDFVEEMDYCSDLLVILFSNYSMGLFDTNEAGELVQLIRFASNYENFPMPKLVPGLLTFVQLVEESEGPTLHVEYPKKKNMDEIEVIASSISIKGSKGKCSDGYVSARGYRGEALISIVTTLNNKKHMVQCVVSPHAEPETGGRHKRN